MINFEVLRLFLTIYIKQKYVPGVSRATVVSKFGDSVLRELYRRNKTMPITCNSVIHLPFAETKIGKI